MNEKHVLHREFVEFLGISVFFVVAAFLFDSPGDIISGLGRILTSRGLLLTDYMVVGNIGAAIINSTLVGLYSVLLLYLCKAKATGATIMALWMAVGWTYWGANVLNILPITCGVWLFARYKKEPFSNFVVMAILGETIAPIVSAFYFSNPIMLYLEAHWALPINILCGIVVGLICGFCIPIIATVTARFHGGYTLYNMGVVGGFIAMLAAALLKCFGITVPTESIWLSGRNTEIAIYLFGLFAILALMGFLFGNQKKINHLENMKSLIKHSGLAPNDFRGMFGDTAYVNMGLLGMIGTAVVLVLKADLDGATFACIFSMVAFGALGKHVVNVLPLILGGVICAFLNAAPVTAPGNILPILFSTCLAPVAGEHGWLWGMATGFMHVVITQHVGSLTNGFNLYNNGFASGFVAYIMLAFINVFSKEKAAA